MGVQGLASKSGVREWLRGALEDKHSPLRVDDFELKSFERDVREELSRITDPAARETALTRLQRATLGDEGFMRLVGAQGEKIEALLGGAVPPLLYRPGSALDKPSPIRADLLAILAHKSPDHTHYVFHRAETLVAAARQGDTTLAKAQLEHALRDLDLGLRQLPPRTELRNSEGTIDAGSLHEARATLQTALAALRQPALYKAMEAFLAPGGSAREGELSSRFRYDEVKDLLGTATAAVSKADPHAAGDVRALWGSFKERLEAGLRVDRTSLSRLAYANGQRGQDLQADIAAFEKKLADRPRLRPTGSGALPAPKLEVLKGPGLVLREWLRAALTDGKTPLAIDDFEMKHFEREVRMLVSAGKTDAERKSLLAQVKAVTVDDADFMRLMGERGAAVEALVAGAEPPLLYAPGGALDAESPVRAQLLELLSFTGSHESELVSARARDLLASATTDAALCTAQLAEALQQLDEAVARLPKPEVYRDAEGTVDRAAHADARAALELALAELRAPAPAAHLRRWESSARGRDWGERGRAFERAFKHGDFRAFMTSAEQTLKADPEARSALATLWAGFKEMVTGYVESNHVRFDDVNYVDAQRGQSLQKDIARLEALLKLDS